MRIFFDVQAIKKTLLSMEIGQTRKKYNSVANRCTEWLSAALIASRRFGSLPSARPRAAP